MSNIFFDRYGRKKYAGDDVIPMHQKGYFAILVWDNKVLLTYPPLVKVPEFPGGTVDRKEDFRDCLYRKLYEETGITSVRLRQILPEKLRYDFPDNALRKYDALYRGQEQSWVLFEFFGSDEEINFFVRPEEVEFRAFEWVDISEAPKRIVNFKKDVYQKVATKFAACIKESVADD